MPSIVSSAPRGSDVVPLVKTIVETRDVSMLSLSQMLSLEAKSVRTLSRNRSVFREPKPPVLRPGTRARTSCALSL